MEANSHWHDDITEKIGTHRDNLSQKEAKKYKLDLLLRVARRIAEFSPECGPCQIFQEQISQLIHDLSNLSLFSRQTRRHYSKTINKMVKHLQQHHKLVTPGQNVGLWIAIGSGIGVAIGAVMGTFGAGIPIGIAIGVAIGSYLDSKARKEGRVI